VNARYPGPHQAIRRPLAPQVAAGTVTCRRCGQLIRPGEPWDLGHDDHDRSIYRGPEHAGGCNRAAGARLGNQRRRPAGDLPRLDRPLPKALDDAPPRSCSEPHRTTSGCWCG
jgi:hypothetical protein